MFKSPCGHLKDGLVKGRIPARVEKETEKGQESSHSNEIDIISQSGCLFCFDYGMSGETCRELHYKHFDIPPWLWNSRWTMYCVCRGTMVVRSCIYFCSICTCYHLRVVFSKNLDNIGHRQLCGPDTVSPLKIPLIITLRPLPQHLAEGNILHCFHRPWFWHFLWFWWYLMLSDSIYFKAEHSFVWS